MIYFKQLMLVSLLTEMLVTEYLTQSLELILNKFIGVTGLTRAVSGEKQIYSGNLEILPGIEKPGKFFGKYEIFKGH